MSKLKAIQRLPVPVLPPPVTKGLSFRSIHLQIQSLQASGRVLDKEMNQLKQGIVVLKQQIDFIVE